MTERTVASYPHLPTARRKDDGPTAAPPAREIVSARTSPARGHHAVAHEEVEAHVEAHVDVHEDDDDEEHVEPKAMSE